MKKRKIRIIEKVDKILCFPAKIHKKRDFMIYKNYQYDSCTTFDGFDIVFVFYSVHKFKTRYPVNSFRTPLSENPSLKSGLIL